MCAERKFDQSVFSILQHFKTAKSNYTMKGNRCALSVTESQPNFFLRYHIVILEG